MHDRIRSIIWRRLARMNTSRDDLKIRLIAVKSSSAGERKNGFFCVLFTDVVARIWMELKNCRLDDFGRGEKYRDGKKLFTHKYDINDIIIIL